MRLKSRFIIQPSDVHNIMHWPNVMIHSLSFQPNFTVLQLAIPTICHNWLNLFIYLALGKFCEVVYIVDNYDFGYIAKNWVAVKWRLVCTHSERNN